MKGKIMSTTVKDINLGLVKPTIYKVRNLKDSSVQIECDDIYDGVGKLVDITKDKKLKAYEKEQFSLDVYDEINKQTYTVYYIHKSKVKEYGYMRDMTKKELEESLVESKV